ncbi:hypothetical protein Leryth_025123 [Lithospermum erythrorhizon]|nr:hypothetical protein Leryth_025123 [Lithospermum erythrorhizon]
MKRKKVIHKQHKLKRNISKQRCFRDPRTKAPLCMVLQSQIWS